VVTPNQIVNVGRLVPHRSILLATSLLRG